MAETTPHPDPLPPPIIDEDDCHVYQPEAEGWDSFDMSDRQMVSGIGCLVLLIFGAGLVIGALWL